MTTSAPASKTALLFSPYRLLTDHIILESLHISKSTEGIQYISNDLDDTELRYAYTQLAKDQKAVLAGFSKINLVLTATDIRQQFASRKAGISFDLFYKTAIARKLHQQLERLKPFSGMLKWYHRLPVEKGRYQTGPCTFSKNRPQLRFAVTGNRQDLLLETILTIDGKTYPLSHFRRFHFLLEHNGTYYLLYFKDYQTLEWLEENDPGRYSRQPREMEQLILSKLEADYPVNRNNFFEKNEITAAPENRVMLSEISNSFLVLTPQWIYEGFLVEGAWNENFETTRNSEPFSIKRDRVAETGFTTLLESLHPNFSRQLNGYFYLPFAEAQRKQWFLKVYHRLLEMNIQVAGMDMLKHFRYSPHKINTRVTIGKQENDALAMEMETTFGNEAILPGELQKTVRAGQRSVLLKDGSLGVLGDEWLQQYGLLIRHGKITGKTMQVPRWLAFSEQHDTAGSQVLKTVIHPDWWQKWDRWQNTNSTVYVLPKTIQASLRPYQQKGFEWMALLAEAGAGACLADDMGLGKTLQTICFIAYQLQLTSSGKHLIICPASLIHNWQEEIRKFAPQVMAHLHYGPGRSVADLTKAEHQVVITSYGTARSDIEQLSAIAFGTVVLDESHNIKNPTALVTRAVTQLQAGTRIALSGTPVMNNTFDLYAQVNFLLPGLFGSREQFKREYADAIDREHDAEKIKALQKITAPFLLRRTKELVATDLPPKTEMVMWCEMNEPQKALYETIKASIRDSIFLDIKNQGLGKSKLALLQGMLKLRQVCNSPLLLPEEERSCSDSVKTELLMDELSSNLKNHKVLVFSQFTGMLDLLAAECRKNGIDYYHFDGQTPPAKRQEMVSAFQQEGNNTNVFLISLKAGNAGLNLTAAGYVFLFDPWWNTAVQQQAIDRTHRIGQSKNIFAYKMICKDSIEEKIIQLQQRKKQLTEDLVGGEDGFVKSLTKEDIEFLFN